MKIIGIWCEHAFQVYSGLIVAKKYLDKNNVIMFTSKINISTINKIMVHENFETVQ